MTKRAERSESNQSTGGLLLVITLLLIQRVEGQPRLCARTDFFVEQLVPGPDWTELAADFHSYQGHVLT